MDPTFLSVKTTAEKQIQQTFPVIAEKNETKVNCYHVLTKMEDQHQLVKYTIEQPRVKIGVTTTIQLLNTIKMFNVSYKYSTHQSSVHCV